MNKDAAKKELQQLINQIEKNQKQRLPGSLQIGSTNEYVKYFHYYPDEKGAKAKCHYLSKSELGTTPPGGAAAAAHFGEAPGRVRSARAAGCLSESA